MIRKSGFRSQKGAPTVSAGYVADLVRYALAHGATQDALAARSGVTAKDLSAPDNRIPFSGYVDLVRAAKSLCGDPALPLRVGGWRDLRELSVVGLICYASPTMGEGLKELNRYAQLVAEVDLPTPGGRFQLRMEDGELWLVDARTEPNAFPEMTESTFARFVCETRRHFPDAPFAKRIEVTHARPDHAAVYDEVYRVPTLFGAARNAIAIDPSWLDIPLHNPSRYAFGLLSERAERLMRELESAKSMRGRVEAALIPLLHKGELGMADLARHLGLSRQTLYRKLKDEGVGYEALVDDLRRRMALHYLDGGKTSVNETAYLVGFSDPSSFSRAFKRWTGESPGRRGG